MNAQARRFGAALCAAALLAAPAGGAETSPPSEWEVKAAYLYNFTRFVEWPDQAAAPPDAPFVVGILGPDPFGRVLDDTLSGKTFNGRPIVVRRLERPESAASVQILFLAAPLDRDGARALRAAQGKPVLTVSNEEGAATHGVVLAFRLRDNRVRFDVNLALAEEGGLKISSHLLKLALNVEKR